MIPLAEIGCAVTPVILISTCAALNVSKMNSPSSVLSMV